MSYYEQDKRLSLAVATLRDIADWNLPGDVYYKNGTKSSYSSAMGSNGVRDYFRQVAREAIERIDNIGETERKAFNVYVDSKLMIKTDWYDAAKDVIDNWKHNAKAIEVIDQYGNHRKELEAYARSND